MLDKEYVFYPPKNSQFFFPKDNFKEFQKFYTPYTLKAKVFWFLFKNNKLIRRLFLIQENKIPLPLKEIKKALEIQNEDYRCFINLGTKGEEQKATIIAKQKNKSCFLKFAQSEIATKLVENEYANLKDLQHQTSVKVPSVIDYRVNINKSYTALTTSIVKGNKLKEVKLSEAIINLLIRLCEIKPHKDQKIIQAFSHGDFCPWNIIVSENDLVLIDWEMAGYKPLGYDLFTFIFQTTFLLLPHKTINDIISTQKNQIDTYFSHFKIELWQVYLTEFATLKLQSEQKKQGSILKERYQELLEYGRH